MKAYNHQEIEKKWQQIWEEQQTYKTAEHSVQAKATHFGYVPYPSGGRVTCRTFL
jgi:leucyl-tRNA synthetase